MRALVDASSLLLLLKHADERKLAELARELTTLDLVAYEASNGILRQAALLKLITENDAQGALRALARLLSKVTIVRWEALDQTEVMKLAIRKRITFYDACYLVAARSLKLPLATEDGRLAAAAADQQVVGWKALNPTR